MLCVSYYIDATTFIEEILMKLQKTIIDRLHRMCLLPLPWLQRAFGLVALLLVSLLLIPPFLHAQDDQVVPRHPYAKELPELGRMIGILGEDCLFGEKIYPIGDCNGDSLSDWILSRRRCDTTIDGKTPEELLLYKGEPGRLPDVKNRLRIGPSEIGAKMKFLAAGDWDGINGTDLAVTISLFGDTSQGGAGFDLHRVVIFWNDGGGNYSVSDTTRIPNIHGGNDLWLGGGNESVVHDYNHDGVEDVLLDIGGSYRSGEWDYTPRRYLFLGCAGERWGKDGKGVEASLQWWSPYDGWIRVPCGGGGGGFVGKNIDGSGKWTVAIGYSCDNQSGIKFSQPTSDLPTTGRVRRLPPGTDRPDTSMSVSNQPSAIGPQQSLGLAVHPNPSSGEVVVSWGEGARGQGDRAIIRITDILGQEVFSKEVPLHQGEYLWDASNLPNGIYYVMLRVDEVTETEHIRIQR